MTDIYQEIVDSILDYPTLFKTTNYETAKMLVIDHIFFTIGCGYEWSKNGTVSDCIDKEQSNRKIPDNYFKTTIIRKRDLSSIPESIRHLIPEYTIVLAERKPDFDETGEYSLVGNFPHNIEENHAVVMIEGINAAWDYWTTPEKYSGNWYIKQCIACGDFKAAEKRAQLQVKNLGKIAKKLMKTKLNSTIIAKITIK